MRLPNNVNVSCAWNALNFDDFTKRIEDWSEDESKFIFEIYSQICRYSICGSILHVSAFIAIILRLNVYIEIALDGAHK